jgi:GntR family transcriptional repressor for pyruvate dehydrogenase complex
MARLHRDIMRVLTDEIVHGERAAGDRLPREQDLAEQFEVSRGVTRECMRAMEERGLISVKHGRGATVNGSEHWDMFDPDVLAAMLDSPRGPDVLTQYVECRRILEVEAAGLAAERANRSAVKRLAEALAEMEQSTALEPGRAAEQRFHEADLAFHQALIAATGNRALGRLVETIHAGLLAARYPLARPQYRTQRALPEHERILAAVAAGDAAEARAAMEAHLTTVAKYLREYAKERERAA